MDSRRWAKKMCSSCQRCKLRDERNYKKLDDENKFFLVKLIGDFKHQMIIPEQFVRRLKGEIPREIKIETRNGGSYPVRVAKYEANHVLTLGWGDFVEKLHLEKGDAILFRYGNSLFTAVIFDEHGREKALSVLIDPFLPEVEISRNEEHENGSARKMDVAPCDRCNLWDEYDYMNLDDEKNYLLILTMGDFQDELIIPKEFVQRLKGEIPGQIELESQNKCIYMIEVVKSHEKLVLTAEWGKFVEKFSLQLGDSIVFRYKGSSHFNVIIFDKFGCEKALSVVVDPFLPHMRERCTDGTDTVNHSPRIILLPHQPAQRQSPIETMNSSDGHAQLMLTQSPTTTSHFHVHYHHVQMQSPAQTVSQSHDHPHPTEMQPHTETGNSSHVDPQPILMQPCSETVNCLQIQSPPMDMHPHLHWVESSQGNRTAMNSSSLKSAGDSDSLSGSFSSEDVHNASDLPGSIRMVRKKANLTTVQKQQWKDGYITTHKTKLNSAQRQLVKEKVQSIHSDIIIFVAKMSSTNVNKGFILTVPDKYAEKYLGDEEHICFHLLGGKWKVSFSVSREDYRVIKGWKKFVQDNNLKKDDICLFELLSNERMEDCITMDVSIIRGNDGN